MDLPVPVIIVVGLALLTLVAIIVFMASFAVGYARVNQGRVLPGVEELHLDYVVTLLEFGFAQVFLHLVQAAVIHYLRTVDEAS